MINKKQAYEQIGRVIKWNESRGNTPQTLNWDLETDMLAEELQELVDADTDVDRLDAILDILFVAYGTLYKMSLNKRQIVDAFECVITANESKSSSKNSSGKITKPANFTGPEPKLQLILDQR